MLLKAGIVNCAVAVRGFLLVLVVLLSGCSMGSPSADVAQQVVEKFYQAQQQQDMEAALATFSNKRSQEDWRAHLEHIAEHLGKVESYEYKRKEVNTVLSGRFYIFEYQVSYSSGKGAKETLTLFDSVDEDDVTAIASHVVAAEGYRQLF